MPPPGCFRYSRMFLFSASNENSCAIRKSIYIERHVRKIWPKYQLYSLCFRPQLTEITVNQNTMAFYKKPDEDESLNEKDPEGIKRGEYRKMGIYDFVRRDIERYHAHPEEAIVSPELLKSKELKPPPEFVRNVWGSAAGVGSGDFHIYRGIRRREYARLEYIEKTAEEEKLNKEFQERQRILDEAAEAKTAKKRLKRQKKKAKRISLDS
ncbi:PRKR-interacting protein 1, variant 2 [Clonorchis sinensis]|uniref:PRKR-interacting protein 1, variant 2 n=1 Tax=Clonorchis sinensis TaxID=79923 RepID=A0A8T1M600_CLOSI|nr:PRKR-interacting protein 1, variant 2 [Clonorchis sinensis]